MFKVVNLSQSDIDTYCYGWKIKDKNGKIVGAFYTGNDGFGIYATINGKDIKVADCIDFYSGESKSETRRKLNNWFNDPHNERCWNS